MSCIDYIASAYFGARALVYDAWIAIKPSRFSVVVVVILFWLATETGLEQGKDAIATTLDIPLLSGRSVAAYFSVFMFGVLIWGFSRISNRVRPPGKKWTLFRYRKKFPARSGLTNAEKIAHAKARLRRIYFIRAYLPRVLGALPPLAILTAYVSATAETPLPKPHAAACVILAGILFVLFWMRRRLLQWASSTFSSNALNAPATPLSDEDFFSFRSFLGENRITAYLTGLAVAFIAAYAVAAVLSPIGTGLGLGPVPVLLLSLSIIVAI